ncbi:ketopantoate reductase family protein [Roseicyclus sp.]|uniref:ketopantoate reductase family protein n=1 Tax=Roseicyclus sp. TaxID=1914329 RepID=UPI003FA16B1C
MRVIVHGMGAVGGVVAAALHRSGAEVVGIARGAMLDAVREHGLRLRAPGIDETLPVPVVAHPGEVDWREDDAILLAMKSQDTVLALEALRDAGVMEHPVFCAQNGVENERAALRFFPNVHGVTVMMPAHYLDPGEVAVFTEPKLGIFDIGRYPRGTDAHDRAICALLDAAGIAAFPHEEVMASKHGKLLLNLQNVIQAAAGRAAMKGPLSEAVRREALAVYAAAGIAWEAVDAEDPRREHLLRHHDALEGVARRGGSTSQSLLRGAARLETDYLNGEIALLGRLHDVPVPVNAALAQIGARLAREGHAAGSWAPGTLEAEVAALGG